MPPPTVWRSSARSGRATSRELVHRGLELLTGGWVESWDDRSAFCRDLAEAPPARRPPERRKSSLPFQLERSAGRGTKVSVTSRPGQHRFSFRVFRRYGTCCAVCDVSVMGLLDAAHLRAYREKGSDDPRNGLVLCATHHRAFDKKLFGIDPSTLRFVYRDQGPDASALGATRPSIAHLAAFPHIESLKWCWTKFGSRQLHKSPNRSCHAPRVASFKSSCSARCGSRLEQSPTRQ